MTVPIPPSLQVLRIELGKSIEAYGFQVLRMLVPKSLVRKTDEEYITLAKEWCKDYRPELHGLARIVRRAQLSGGGASDSLKFDLASNTDGVAIFLESPETSYIAAVFQEGMKQTGQELLDFLKLMQQLAK